MKYFNFKQGNLSVTDYTCEFEFLIFKCDIKEPEPQTIAYYIGGLTESIGDMIWLQPYWTFNNVRKLAYDIERQQAKESKKSTPSFKRPYFSNQRSSTISHIEIPTKGNTSNPSSISKTDEKRVSGDATKRRCFKCQGTRHLQPDCPNRRAIIYIGDQLIEIDLVKEDPDDNKPEEDDVVEEIEPDEGELLVIQ